MGDPRALAIILTVPGKPLPKARPRTVRKGDRIMTYTPKETVAWEKTVKLVAQATCSRASWKPTRGRVSLTAQFVGLHPLTDLDNAVKAIQDALNGVAYVDDRQIDELHAERVRPLDEWTGVIVTVREI